MIIAALLLAALSVEGQVFHEPLCENLPEVRPEVKAWVAQVAPELAQVSVRELPEQTALDVFGRAAAAGWGSVDVLTNSVFREPCTFYFSREALRAVNAAFVLDLVTAIQGQDKKGQDFEMIALLAGRGKIVVLYRPRRDRVQEREAGPRLHARLPGRIRNAGRRCARKCPGALRQCPAVGLRARPLHREGRRDAQGTSRDLHLADAIEADPGSGHSGHAPSDARRSGSEASAFHDLALVIDAGRQVQRGFSVKWVRECAYLRKRALDLTDDATAHCGDSGGLEKARSGDRRQRSSSSRHTREPAA